MIDFVQPFLLDRARLRQLHGQLQGQLHKAAETKAEGQGVAEQGVADFKLAELGGELGGWMKEVSRVYEIKISGILYGGEIGALLGMVSLEAVKRALERALMENPEIIVLKIDSPGGTVAGIADLADYLYSLREVVPIYVYSAGMIASAAYWIASSAQKLVISQTAVVGSIGVVTTIYDDRAYYERKGIKMEDVVNDDSPQKRMDYFSKQGKANLKKKLNDIAEIFFKAVARSRGRSVAEIKRRYGRGDTLMGFNAKQVGMVDEVLSYEDFKQKIGADQMNKRTEDGLRLNSKEVEARRVWEMEAFKRGEEAGRQQERERVAAILSLPGAEAFKMKVIEKGVAFLVAKKEILQRNQLDWQANSHGVIATAKESDFQEPDEFQTKQDDALEALIQKKRRSGEAT